MVDGGGKWSTVALAGVKDESSGADGSEVIHLNQGRWGNVSWYPCSAP